MSYTSKYNAWGLVSTETIAGSTNGSLKGNPDYSLIV